MCDDVPILAAYHSSSVGFTKSSEEVWGGALSYLVPVFAPESKEVSAKTVKIDKQKVKSVFLKNGLNGDFCFNYDGKGMCIGAVSGDVTLSPKKIMGLLGLRSDTFTASEDGDSFVFTSYGFGHGVGMSQYGADALAKDGYSFYEILEHYYTGISFAFFTNSDRFETIPTNHLFFDLIYRILITGSKTSTYNSNFDEPQVDRYYRYSSVAMN